MIRPFSILDIGRRINALSIESELVIEAQAGLSETSIEYQRNQSNLDRSQAERQTLHKLAMTLNPDNTADAAVQLALAFCSVGMILETEQAKPVQADLKLIERTIADVTRVLATAAGVDLRQFGEADLTYQMDQRAPVASGKKVPA